MPNQMIALQARNPQLPDPARATTQMANMMNMASQQRAAQLQGERIRQEMDYARAGEERAAETQRLNVRKEDQAFRVAGMTELRNRGVAVLRSGSEEAYQLWLKQADAIDPDSAAVMRQIAPTFNKDALTFAIMKADEYINKTFPNAEARVEYAGEGGFDAQGRPIPENTPLQVITGIDASTTPIGAAKPTPQPAPRATPTAPPVTAGTDVDMRATRGVNTTPRDLIEQGMDPNNIPSGMPTSRPISFNQNDMGGAGAVQMTPDVMSRIVDSAFQTGVMAQVDFDQLLASQPPQNKQALVDSFRRAKITLQADAPSLADSALGQQQPMAANPVQTPQSQFAVMRGEPMQSQTAGLRGAPPMEQTLAQYIPVQRRDPNQPIAPGSSVVPIERVRQEAVAGRETAGEVYAKEKARARAQREAAIEAGPKPLTPVQEAKLRDNIAKDYKSARSTISMMLDPVSGVVASVNKVRKLSPSQKEAITGYSGYLPSITPGARSADTAIKNLRGKVTEMGKSAAALTGAIGQMAVQEWRIVSDMIASLDIEGMEPADLDNQLDIIEAQARRAAEVTRDAYENQYVEEFARYPGRFQLPSSAGTPVNSRPKAESQLPRIRGNADYNKLKPGTEFIDPNGVRRRKPK